MSEHAGRRELADLLEVFLLGEEPSLTATQVAEQVGIPYEDARVRWRSLGFSEVDPDEVAFTRADLDALRLTQELVELGVVDEEDQSALVRTMGRSFARLTEWQLGLLARVVDVDEMSVEELTAVMERITPAVEQLQSYVWRRHTVATASRLLLADAPEASGDDDAGTDSEGVLMGVGFADIVGFTRQSRSLSRRETARLVDRFEERALEIVSAHGGRIIKSIGDEVLFVADRPEDVAAIALELVEETDRDGDFPELRVGLAWGRALARFGDVLGPVVNLASRLTGTSRPGRVLVDRALAEELQDRDGLKLRRVRRTSVKGYRRLEPWSLRRGDRSAEQDRGRVGGVVDEDDGAGHGTSVGEGAQERPDR
ncbi:adenylate/guanylate cyclase domain-containing protein [Nocardioides aurantiacus]|uniref:Adenylate cyclase n=1 Tax=Nocardioides aurantiacus TaxID=86796 RepID=A0A3N2CX67_9ACTN|nr:adenylate/guanylate cyclase domain-containing protein [Nocardioides aurantiacus]ROR92121.1 adenylate cyclase [Nocardioides aurantiacus]